MKDSLVPIGHASTIVRELLRRKHWTRREIADACMVGPDTITGIKYRRRKHILATTMDALLELERTADCRRTMSRGRSDARLAGRAVQGLFAQGYTYRWIARSVNAHEDTIYKLAQHERKWVNPQTEQRLLALVKEIGSTPGPSGRARTLAKKHGWLPTMYDDRLV